MKITIPKPTEIECAAIRCVLAVRYDEEDIPLDFPHRNGDIWDIIIDIDTGTIRDWPKGPAESVYMKVCDEGSYYLLSDTGEVLASLESDYVPGCIPGKWGDYIDFDIDENGKINNWHVDAMSVANSFFPTD